MARSETLQNGILWICSVWNLIVLSLSLSLYLYDNSLKSFKLPQLKQGASLYIWISNQEVPQPRDLFLSAYTLYVWWFIGSVESKLQNVAVCIAQSIIISLRVDSYWNQNKPILATDKLVTLRSEVLVCHCRHNFCRQYRCVYLHLRKCRSNFVVLIK